MPAQIQSPAAASLDEAKGNLSDRDVFPAAVPQTEEKVVPEVLPQNSLNLQRFSLDEGFSLAQLSTDFWAGD